MSRGGGGARGGVAQGPRAEPIRRREGPAHPEGVQSRGVIAWTSSWGGGGAEEVRRVRTAETRDIERDRSKEREAPRERLVRSKVFERCLPEAGCGMQAGVVPETDPGDRASALHLSKDQGVRSLDCPGSLQATAGTGVRNVKDSLSDWPLAWELPSSLSCADLRVRGHLPLPGEHLDVLQDFLCDPVIR